MIDSTSVQAFLKERGFYRYRVDGLFGDRSFQACRELLSASAPLYRPEWSNSRVRLAVEQFIMSEAKIDVGAIDGVEGVMTQYGWEQWQNRLRRRTPRKSGTPSAFCRQTEAQDFYGPPGTNHTRITPPYQVYYGDQPMNRGILINAKCAESASRAMTTILNHYGPEEIHRLGLDRFAGCFYDRPMRGGTKKSMHAFACAIDWDAARNPLRADHRTAQFARPEYAAFLDAWEAEGWTSLGRAKDFDWMHVQAASL
jgi:hypothetical protein